MSLLQISALSCHYSCSTCAGSTYSDCSSCPGKDRITIVPPHLEGLCQGQTPLSFNPLGFVVLVLVIGACVSSKSEEAIHLSLGLQSLGLLGLVEVNCGQAITYVLDALEYLFVLVKIGQAYKPEDNVLSGDKLYKGQALLHTADYSRNAAIVGFVVLLVFALVFLLPLYQCIRRKLTADKYHCLPDWFLEKVSFVLYVVYLFTIQEMMLVIFIGYAYSATNFVLIASSIVYFLTLLYICVSSCYKQLPFFRSRAAQLNAILKKIILPVFVLAGPSFHYIIFCVLLSFECVDIVLTCKRKVAT